MSNEKTQVSYRLLGADDLLSVGFSSFAQLRPVLNQYTPATAINTTLRKDEWEAIDGEVGQVMRERLTIADQLRSKGLVAPISIGTILRVSERLEDFDTAEVSFDGDTAPQMNKPNFKRDVIPVPVISKDFKIGFRQLDASRRRGESLDVTAAGLAARKVRDQLQSLFANGLTQGPGANPVNGSDGQSIPGLTTHANRETFSIAPDWNVSGNHIIPDVQAMLQKQYANNFFGPFALYVPKNYWALLQADYSSVKGDKTYIERILAFQDIQNVLPLDSLADGNVVLLQETSDVIQLTEAQSVTTVQWNANPFVMLFRVIMIGGPHIKNSETSNGTTKVGIVHGT